MKTNSHQEKINFHRPGLRLIAAGALFLAAAGLAATALHPPQLPWAPPIARAGINPLGAAVDPATNTVYVSNGLAHSLAIIDGSKCNSQDSSGCVRLATVDVGLIPTFTLFDPTTSTVYVMLAGGHNNVIAVVDTRTCSAQDISGCHQARVATTTFAGRVCTGGCGINLALAVLDATNHSLYVGDAKDRQVSVINTSNCNGTDTSGCGLAPAVVAAKGDGLAIDHANHNVYVTDYSRHRVSVFDGTTCNALDQSTCNQPPGATFAVDFAPVGPAVIDNENHTLYLPLFAGEGLRSPIELIDTTTCNTADTSGCEGMHPLTTVGAFPGATVLDSVTKTIYVLNFDSSRISVLDATTCNANDQSGCDNAQELAVGLGSVFFDFNPQTHTLYTPSQDTDTVWAVDVSRCSAIDTSGCTRFAPVTEIGTAPVGIEANPNTKTVYVGNQLDNTVSVIDASICNAKHRNGCKQGWPTVAVGNAPRSLGINRVTNTIYVPNLNDGTVSVINGATCNGSDSSGCNQTPTATTVGAGPQEAAIDESANTIYVANQNDNTVSVIDGTHCNGSDSSGCNQSWPVIAVGALPQALSINPDNHTLYVANTGDNTVSVISGNSIVATIPVGSGPRAIGIVRDKNTIFVENRNDLTVSVIDGSTCNGSNTTGCSQMPPAVLIGAFPRAAGNSNYISGRRIAIDQHTDLAFIPTIGDSDVAVLDGNTCNASHPQDCHVRIVPQRMGGFSVFATVDESSGTVYVANDDDGTVSLFPSGPR